VSGHAAAHTELADKAQTYLHDLQTAMDSGDNLSPTAINQLVEGARIYLRRDAYPDPADSYAVQGYVYYFQKNYEASVKAFERALAVNPNQSLIRLHFEKAKVTFAKSDANEWLAYQ